MQARLQIWCAFRWDRLIVGSEDKGLSVDNQTKLVDESKLTFKEERTLVSFGWVAKLANNTPVEIICSAQINCVAKT